VIFRENLFLLKSLQSKSLNILSHFPQEKGRDMIWQVQEEVVDQTKPWAFFDGASQNNNLLCGGGALLFLSENHSYKLKMGLGPGTNNYVELMSLKLLLLFSKEKEVDTLHIFGDSLNVINWARKLQHCSNILLLPYLKKFTDFGTLLTTFLFAMSTGNETWMLINSLRKVYRWVMGSG
jgi:hypothetical protein